MIKSRRAKGKADVTFTVDPQVGAQTAVVCGEWNDWSADADVMHCDADGGFSVTVSLDAGRAYRFRYLLDGHRWDNDWSADAYQANGFGGDDSVVDLTALAQAVPAATKKAVAKKQREEDAGGEQASDAEEGTGPEGLVCEGSAEESIGRQGREGSAGPGRRPRRSLPGRRRNRRSSALLSAVIG